MEMLSTATSTRSTRSWTMRACSGGKSSSQSGSSQGKFATYANRAFALGQAVIDEAATYSFDCALNVFDNPISWLLAKRDGIVVLDWTRASDRLRDAPRIALAESLLPLYRRHMEPARTPELFIISGKRRAA
ncbi:hypothetical protein [Mesorhizobium sp.]|uniref:hypothetical protein n=1 Tax=Mesorhizobium sp. TaxID=1871066 RepID=UPI00257C5F44|nr:hypothetical protein [Mesorhizobium sp.]